MGRGPELGGGVRAIDRRLHGAGPPLKVLDLTEFYSPSGGGVRTYLEAKARWFGTHDDLQHVVVVPGPEDGRTVHHRSQVYSLAGPSVPSSPGYHVLTGHRRLRAILRREQPDIIELGSVYLAPWALRMATRGSRLPTIGFFHMDLVGVARRAMPTWLPRALARGTGTALARYLRAAYRDCRVVVGASESALASLAEAGIERIALVPLGVDLACFHPSRRDPRWRTELGVGDDRPLALYVGRLAGERNVEVMVRALPALHRRTGLKLVCVGDGERRARLAALAAAQPAQIAVLPFEANPERLARVYASADLLVAPFPHETFGLAALEAAASGLPVVCASEGAVAHRLRGEDWARAFESHSPSSLVEAVEVLLAGDRVRLRAAARQAAEGWSWEHTFTRLLTVYEGAVSRAA
jgi:alpha-1,6-mannosyltransferase